MADSYRGVFGAIPYAIRHTESWTMRLYGVVGALAAGLIATVVTLALVVWMGETVGVQSGTFLFSRSLFVVGGFAAVAPLLAPLLFVARRHRRGEPVADGYDRKMAYGGFLFLASLYAGLVVSAPADLRDPTESVVLGALYALPRAAGIVPPMAAAIVVFAIHFRLRERGGSETEAIESSADDAQ
ncbi:hypothetical protein [Halorubrum trueperi]|uniref:DUF8056 domain-containing protein n=1 Tax=Halorubrum trueperi TaxID=2004704 RepID=A0ABD5UMS2_9EURY